MTTDPFEGIPDPSESFLSDVLFPFFDDTAAAYGLNSDEVLADLARVLRPSVLDEYRIWVSESWEAVEPAVPFMTHGPDPRPAIFKPTGAAS